VEVGLVAACITFIYRISSLSRADRVDAADYPQLAGRDTTVHAFRLHGAIFFGAVKLIENMMDHLPQQTLVLDFKNVLYIDSSGADTLQDLMRTCQLRGVRLVMCGLAFQPKDILQRCGIVDAMGPDNLSADLSTALALAVPTA